MSEDHLTQLHFLKMIRQLSLLCFFASCLVSVYGHGYLLDPVARSSAWMVDQSFRQCCTYNNHMEMYCGGIQTQWSTHGWLSFQTYLNKVMSIL